MEIGNWVAYGWQSAYISPFHRKKTLILCGVVGLEFPQSKGIETLKLTFQKQKAGEILNRNEVVLNRLRAIIGDELFREVCFQMPGEDIHIPVFGNGFTSIKDRNWAIRQDVWKGKSILEASKKYELSQSQIYKILKSRE